MSCKKPLFVSVIDTFIFSLLDLLVLKVPNTFFVLLRLDYRKEWDKDFQNYLKNLDKIKPVILCGDLNVAHKEIGEDDFEKQNGLLNHDASIFILIKLCGNTT